MVGIHSSQLTVEEEAAADKSKRRAVQSTLRTLKTQQERVEERRRQNKEWMKADYLLHPKKYRNRSKDWRQSHPKEVADRKRQYAKKWKRLNRTKKMLALKRSAGGKCKMCGYDKNLNALEFHHREPEQKVGAISWLLGNVKFSMVLAEVEKCDLICRNCHAGVENGVVT